MASSSIRVYDGDIGEWLVTPPLVVEFTGGTDVTNATLIAWLEANGTLTAPTPTANTYTLTHTLTNVTKGNITLQLTPDTGYELPDTITVTNGTLVSYDKTTGIAVISGDDNTSVSVECVATPSGYNLTINYNHNDDWYGEGWTKVYIKLNGDPTNNNDYDYVLESPYAGSVGYIRFRGDEIKVLSFEEDYTFIINNVVNYTMWGITERSSTHLTANGVNVNDYNNKQKTTLSANAALTILHPWDD